MTDRCVYRALGAACVLAVTLGAMAQPADSPDATTRPATTQPAQPKRTPAEQALDDGWKMVRISVWELAQQSFNKAIQQAQTDEVRAQGEFGLAYILHMTDGGSNADKAAAKYGQLAEKYPDSSAAPYGLVMQARILEMPKIEKDRTADRIQQARQIYHKVRENYPGHAMADEATLRLAMTYLENVGSEEAQEAGAAILTDYLVDRPRNIASAAMYYMLGQVWQRRGDWAKAVQYWSKSANDPGLPGGTERARLYYMIAHAQEHELKNYRKAAYWYGRIVIDTPRDAKYYVAKQAMLRCEEKAGVPGGSTTQPANADTPGGAE